jgi:hypothetical protein
MTDSTFINNSYRAEKDCEKQKPFIYSVNARQYEQKLIKKNSEFHGFISYENIRIDSVSVDTAYKDETLIKLYK